MPATPQRILFVLPGLVAGGAERVMIGLMNGLDRASFIPELAALENNGPMAEQVAKGAPVHTFGAKRTPLTLFRLLRLIRATRPDIIVSTSVIANLAVLLLKPFLPRGTRIIARETTMPSIFTTRGALKGWLIHTACGIFYPMADIVLCPSRAVRDECVALLRLREEKTRILPNPVDEDTIRARAAQNAPPLGRADFHFLCVGRLHPDKGFDRLIDALPHLQRDDAWHLTIFGEGAQRADLENRIRALNLAPRVTLAGHSADPCPAMRQADLFLLPSRSEGLPNAALEALACGTNVLAIREAGGINEIATHTSAVTVTDTMDAFISHMGKAQKNTDGKESRLPKLYRDTSVMPLFLDIIRF